MRAQLADGRVLIRAYRPDDAFGLHEAVLESLPELRPYMPWAHAGYSLDDAQQWIANCQDAWRKGRDYNFAIVDRDGTFTGGCDLEVFSQVNVLANLGYWVRSSRTGLGIATVAARLLARLGFEDLGLERIEILMAVENLPSRRVAEKAGATFEGTLRRRLRLHDVQHDAYMFSLTRDDPRL